MKPISTWSELLQWSPPMEPGRAARIKRFAAILHEYDAAFGPLPEIVKVTGTAGKGSVCAMLEAALLSDLKSVGLFTSPHLVQLTERIRVGGLEVSSAELDDIAVRTGPFFQRIVEELGMPFRPSFFEALLVLALRLFAEAHCDIALMEVAIGGSNDVLSLVPGPVSTITSVGLDHTDELGSTLADVAVDKAGIATAGSTLVIGPAIKGIARAAIEQEAEPRGTRIVSAAEAAVMATHSGLSGHDVEIATPGGTLAFSLPLAGAFQIDNLKTAYTVLRVLAEAGLVTRPECITGIAQTRWPARLEFFPGDPSWLLDSAHNSLAFSSLKTFLRRYLPPGRRSLLLGVSEVEKGFAAIRILGPLFPTVYLVGGFYRAVDPRALDCAFSRLRHEAPMCFADTDSAVRWILQSNTTEEHCVVVAGSIYLAGECRSILSGLGYSSGRPVT